MILSQFEPDFNHTQARKDIGNPYEMHRTVRRLLKDESPLWRLHGSEVLVLSERPPVWDEVARDYFRSEPRYRDFPIDDLPLDGRRLRFRLRANPTVAKLEGVPRGKRGKRRQLYRQEDQIAWLQRKGLICGFEVLEVTVEEGRDLKFRKKGQTITIFSCLFEGLLRVTDVVQFRDVLRKGVGPGKSFGMGLLSIAPA